MADGALPKPPGRVRGRPFEKGRSGNPAGRRTGSCNRTTAAAAMRLCIERVLPACRERAVKFALPPIDSAADIAAAIKAVTSALAEGAITPGEAATIAAVVDTFVRAIETSDFDRRLQFMEESFASRATAEASARPAMRYNFEGRFCCRFAAGAATGNQRYNIWLQVSAARAGRRGRRSRGSRQHRCGRPRRGPGCRRIGQTGRPPSARCGFRQPRRATTGPPGANRRP